MEDCYVWPDYHVGHSCHIYNPETYTKVSTESRPFVLPKKQFWGQWIIFLFFHLHCFLSELSVWLDITSNWGKILVNKPLSKNIMQQTNSSRSPACTPALIHVLSSGCLMTYWCLVFVIIVQYYCVWPLLPCLTHSNAVPQACATLCFLFIRQVHFC